MTHGPPSSWGTDNTVAYKTRLGIVMFIIYCIVYAGFVVINLVKPDLMGRVFAGQNLAVIYGFGLIVLALVMAIIYTTRCTRAETRLNPQAAASEDEL